MNTKDLDAIKQVVARLRHIRETEFLIMPVAWNVGCAVECLQEVIDTYEDTHTENTEEIRAD